MRRQKRMAMWVALGTMGLMLTGCESAYDLRCSSDKDCLESEICHPDELLCVQLCTTVLDCPDNAKKCEALSTTNTTKICKCMADCD